jgi:hypothetical protein
MMLTGWTGHSTPNQREKRRAKTQGSPVIPQPTGPRTGPETAAWESSSEPLDPRSGCWVSWEACLPTVYMVALNRILFEAVFRCRAILKPAFRGWLQNGKTLLVRAERPKRPID